MMSLDKSGYQLTLIPSQPTTADDINEGNGSVQRESYLIFQKYVWLGFGANKLVKEFKTKG